MLKNLLLASVLVSILVATGCATYSAPLMGDTSPSLHTALATKESEMPQRGRILIQDAFLRLEVSDLEALSQQSEKIAAEEGGYVENSEKTEERRVRLILRVPSDKLDTSLDRLSLLGKIQHRSTSARDVTEEVIDTDARLKNNMALRDRLRILLQQAKDVKDVLAVEEQLTRVQADIDSMEGRLKALKSRAALSKIVLTGEKKTVLGPLGYLFTGLWWGVSKLFVIK